MRKIIAFALLFAFASCSNPEQNTATGNSADSLHNNDSNATDKIEPSGPGVDNSGGTNSTGTFTDSSTNKIATDSSHHNR